MPVPTAKSMREKSKVSKRQLVNYLLEHAIDLTFSAEELAKLPITALLNEKVYMQTDDDNDRLRSPQELTAIEFILAQPDNFLSRTDLEAMCSQDLLAEERWLQAKTRKVSLQSIFYHH
ncbi:MAG: hypothetical protein HY817_02720 [Candidatus Abawacabacteria bacterium]|nr:hypothetical protein [Candidatus Abawacabacteria bacterium]